jgi:hypothetical protein
MHRAALAVGLLVRVAAATAGAQTSQPPAGLIADWDVGVILNEISSHAARLAPVLNAIDAQAWVAKGAPDAYAAQLQSAKDQTRAVQDAARDLAASPDRLADSLELFFRIQGIDSMIASLVEGMRKYQSAADAESLAAKAAENGANRDRLRQYLITLAADRERQLDVMDREAQRCRAELSAQPAPAAGKKKQE